MKPECFLALPLLATLFNVSIAILLALSHSHAQPVINAGLADRCVSSTGEDCAVGLDDYLHRDILEEPVVTANADDDEEPQLQMMPGLDVKAYVRADIATFYGEEPGSRKEHKPEFKGQATKMVNMSPDRVSLYWDGPNGPLLNDHLGPWQAGGTASFPGHKFIFTKLNSPKEVLCRMSVVTGVSVYYCDPFADENSHPTADPRQRGVQLSGGNRSLDELSEQDREKYEAHKYNLHFAALYRNFTGSEWLTMFPRNPPRHKIWRADRFNQEHHISTKETQFIELPPKEVLGPLSRSELRNHQRRLSEYRAPGEMNITIKAVSCQPRAFEIRNFLSDVEVDHILGIVNQKRLERSTTNGHLSETRTSSTTWISRQSDPILDAVLRRVADTLRMDEALLRYRDLDEHPELPTKEGINEDLQIVHYNVGQQYTAHHDFGYPKGHPDSPSRSINLCMYLKTVEEGGETSFPRWRNAETGKPLNVKPEKGKAMIFYMINPDGNLEDLTHHAALPVIKGEKYFANLWIHDPIRLAGSM